MADDKIYAPMSAKEKKFNDGGSALNLSAKADKLIAWINEHANEKGYINLVVSPRREVGQ